MLDEHLNSLIRKLESLRKDDNATPFFDVMSGGFVWSDERLRGLNIDEMGCLRGIFRYRTSLIVGETDDRFKALWDDLKNKYPDWIGFDAARCVSDESLVSLYRKIRLQH